MKTKVLKTADLKKEIRRLIHWNVKQGATVKYQIDGNVLTMVVWTEKRSVMRVDTFIKEGQSRVTQTTKWFRETVLMKSREKKYRIRGKLDTIFEKARTA